MGVIGPAIESLIDLLCRSFRESVKTFSIPADEVILSFLYRTGIVYGIINKIVG